MYGLIRNEHEKVCQIDTPNCFMTYILRIVELSFSTVSWRTSRMHRLSGIYGWNLWMVFEHFFHAAKQPVKKLHITGPCSVEATERLFTVACVTDRTNEDKIKTPVPRHEKTKERTRSWCRSLAVC